MTQYGPKDVFIYITGRNISGDTFDFTETVEGKITDARGFGLDWDASLPVGVGVVTVEAGGGLYDDRIAGMLEVLQAKGDTLQLLAYGMAGKAIGADCVILNGTFATVFKRIFSRDDLTKAGATHKISSEYRRARIIHGPTAETTDPGNTQATSVDQLTAPRLTFKPITNATVANPTVVTAVAHGLITGDVINIAGSTTTPTLNGKRTVTVVTPDTFTVTVNVSSGGVQTATFQKLTSTNAKAQLHVLALTLGGFTNVIVTLQHSADNSAWSTLTTFTANTVIGAEEKIIAGQVQEFTAILWDFTGAGSGQSVTPFVALSRDN